MKPSQKFLLARSAGACLLLSALFVAGCSVTPPQAASGSLSGTAWQLAAIQSMDDAQGTTRINDPQRFSLLFEANGKAAMRLDCNRGMADWRTEAVGPDGGQLRFGPVAATRALCPPPHLDERVARDLSHVRSYRIKDGKLYMSLEADGGIYEWIPQPR